MEPAPALDASRPSPLRLTGFLLTVVGALLAGIGAVGTWVTVGISGQGQLDSVTKGTDIWEGKVVLACAAVMLVGVLVTRMVHGRGARRAFAALVAMAGLAAAGIGAWFLATASSNYSPVDSAAIADKLAQVLDVPTDQAAADLQKVVDKLGGFTTIGTGPKLALLGGVLGLVGGILVLMWTSRTASGTPEPAEDDAPTGSETV